MYECVICYIPSYSFCCYAALALTVDITRVESAIAEVQISANLFD